MRKALIDTTLRDGNQSLWATRMTTDMFLPVLETLDQVGFESIEHMSTVHMDACVRYLGEDPWERMRICRERVKRTPLRMLGMSQFFSISRVMPDDVVELFTRTCAKYVDIQWITASMNDVRTAEVPIRAAKAAGNQVEGGTQFTISPVHTDDFFVSVVRELVVLDVDGIIIKDAGGLLTPERARVLVPKVVAAAGGVPVRVHSHCVTGMGPAANLEALDHGADAIWVATPALANGASLPSSESIARALEWKGDDLELDRTAMRHIDDHFREVARIYDKPLGQPAEYDPRYYAHQIPGGMISNFRAQLRDLGKEDELDAVLDEMPLVRHELGYPNIQTPYSQFVATQALLNVLHGRYEVVPDEIRRFVLGYWGRTPGPIDGDVLDKVGRGEEPVNGRPGEMAEPLLDRVRAEHGPFDSEEDLLLAVFFMPELLRKMRSEAGRRPSGRPTSTGPASLVDLVKEAASSPEVRHFSFVSRS